MQSHGLTTLNKSNSIPVTQQMTPIKPSESSTHQKSAWSKPLTATLSAAAKSPAPAVEPPAPVVETKPAAEPTETQQNSQLELGCRHGENCHGECGGCAFNHTLVPFGADVCVLLSQIADADRPKICRYDMPWDNLRCTLPTCGFEHFRGYVALRILRQQKQATELADKKQKQKKATKPSADATVPVAATPADKKQKQAAKPPAAVNHADALVIAEDLLVQECLSQHHDLNAINQQLTTVEGYTWKQMFLFSGDSIDVETWSFSRARFFASSSFQNKLRAKIKVAIPDAWVRINVTQEKEQHLFSISGEKLRIKE